MHTNQHALEDFKERVNVTIDRFSAKVDARGTHGRDRKYYQTL